MRQKADFIRQEYDVIIIGGGITGAGTARDCSMRGLKTLLIERYDFTCGATGRNHGLLHSGARYAVTDEESATECISENMILRRIARHCIDETDGLFITLPEDDLDYQASFVQACLRAGIRADIISPEEARRLEPSINPNIIGAVRVPDASVDPFRLTTANVLDAVLHGADVLTYHEVIGFVMESGRMVGVKIRDNQHGEISHIRGRITINAAGIWGHLVARMAGVTVNMFPAKGSLLIFGHRVNNMVINRCRKPSNADILVPDDTVCVIGTTSDRVSFDEIDNIHTTAQEVDVLLREGEKLVPALSTTRILRAYAGVRPLVAADNDPTGRSISRGIVCLDHELRDGLAGFITITGGKMMTYRLMAEMATNLACQKLGVPAPCQTATTPLPGSNAGSKAEQPSDMFSMAYRAAKDRHGTLAESIQKDDSTREALVCECEEVSMGEIEYAMKAFKVHNLVNLRRRTRVGMGSCQGKLCSCRAANIMCGMDGDVKNNAVNLASFMMERWKGMRPVAWGTTLNEAQLTSAIYQDLCGLNLITNETKEQQ